MAGAPSVGGGPPGGRLCAAAQRVRKGRCAHQVRAQGGLAGVWVRAQQPFAEVRSRPGSPQGKRRAVGSAGGGKGGTTRAEASASRRRDRERHLVVLGGGGGRRLQERRAFHRQQPVPALGGQRSVGGGLGERTPQRPTISRHCVSQPAPPRFRRATGRRPGRLRTPPLLSPRQVRRCHPPIPTAPGPPAAGRSGNALPHRRHQAR